MDFLLQRFPPSTAVMSSKFISRMTLSRWQCCSNLAHRCISTAADESKVSAVAQPNSRRDLNSSQFSENARLDNPPQPATSSTNSNETVNPEYFNRNPRNMEMMNLALKRTGWTLDAEKKDYYNKLVFERKPGHTQAFVMHTSGRKIVSASTEEFAIARHLYRTTDVSAAENIGRVLARRMLETGVLYVYSAYTEEDRKSDRIKVFLNALADGGIQLTEPARIFTPNPFGGMDARHLKSTSIRRHIPKTGAKKPKPVIMPQEVD